MSPFRRILEYARPYRSYLILNIGLNLLYSLLAIFSVSSLFPILGILFGDVSQDVESLKKPVSDSAFGFDNVQYELTKWISEAMEKHGSLIVLAWLCAITVVSFLLRNLFRYFAQYFMVGLRSGVSRDLRNALYEKVVSLPVAYFTEQRKGDLMTRISSDVDNVQRFTLIPIVELVRAPFMIVATLCMLIYMNAQLTLAALIILPVMGFVISTISKSLRGDTKEAQHLLGRLISNVEETLGASKIIKIFNAEKILKNKFFGLSTAWRGIYNRVERKYELASPVSELLGSITMILLVWYGGKIILTEGTLTGAVFLSFIGLFFQLLDPAKSLAKAISDISRGNASAERVLEVLDTDVVINEVGNPIPIAHFENNIEFKEVNFKYTPEHHVIKNFNLCIEKGQTVALVGQSGSGKTTIANLLARFYDVQEGAILIDGKPLKELSLEDYRRQIGMVTQESVLFNDTVFSNIALGKEKATEEEVEGAAQIANAMEFIEKLPHKFQENIGEGGSKLSGGQKQRMSIARAVLKNPPIMILDEATSALDTHSERLVQEALDHMMQNRTSLIIAHRLSTIKNADLIVVMDEGEIKEQGKHEELMAENGIYAKLIEMQGFK